MEKYLNLLDKLEKAQPSYYVAVVPYNPMYEAVLLGHRREDGIWTTPAGGANRGETPEDCAVRECWEEAQLEVDKSQLIPICVKEAPNGKPVHCFAYVTGQERFSISSDPDREVPEWQWHRINNLPEGLSRQKNQNRLETINQALMTLKGLVKAKKIKMDKEELIDEHEHLIQVLESDSHKDDKKEAKKQKKELEGYVKKSDTAQMGEVRTHADGSQWRKTPQGWVQEKRESPNKVKDLNSDKTKKIKQITKMKGSVAEGENYQKMLESMDPEKLNALHAKLVESQPVDPRRKNIDAGLQKRKKDMESGAKTGQKTKSGKEISYNMEDAVKNGFTPEDHRDAMNFHFDTAQKMSELMGKMKDEGIEIPSGAKEIVDAHKKMSNAHSKAASAIEKRRDKVKKSITQMGNSHGDPDIDVGSFATQVRSADCDLLERLRSLMTDFGYGDTPRELPLDSGTLYLSKIDDGMYSGFFRKRTVTPEGEMWDNAGVRIEKQTLPTLANFMVAKDWYVPVSEREGAQENSDDTPMTDEQYQALNAKLEEISDGVDTMIEMEASEGVQEESELDKKIRVLELLNKLLG